MEDKFHNFEGPLFRSEKENGRRRRRRRRRSPELSLFGSAKNVDKFHNFEGPFSGLKKKT